MTARDVRWTYDVIMDPKNMTGPHKISMERFDHPKSSTNTPSALPQSHSLEKSAGCGRFHVLPRSAFANTDFNTINFEFPVVSGPYKLGDIEEGVWVKLERRSDWWQASAKSAQHKGNFATITYKFFAERTNAFEAFKKALLIFFPCILPDLDQ
ncbi:MAG: ABC transporter substrate-binding protein [Desulfobacterales bacterium]